MIPSAPRLHVDCRVPPGNGARPRCWSACATCSATDGYGIEFTEQVVGNASPPRLAAARRARRLGRARANRAPAACPTISAGYSDSRTFRDAFPECVAYGFFPFRAHEPGPARPLAHGRDERIDVRDLALAVDCYREVATELLG